MNDNQTQNFDELLQATDFYLKVYSGVVSYNNSKNILIEIFDVNNFNINIEETKIEVISQQLYNKIKSFVRDNLNALIDCSIAETKYYLDRNMYDGGVSKNITVKWGGLLANVNGQVNGNIKTFVDDFIDHLKTLILNEGNKSTGDVIKEYIENTKPIETPITRLDEEFEKYCNLYEERFNKKAYIPEPSGTKEFVIECIKKCLEEDKDILDDLYYPNFKKDMENGILYSETQRDLNIDDVKIEKNIDVITDENLKKMIDELINNGEYNGDDVSYYNRTVYDIIKKIIDLPNGTTTTIANLINYNPNEKFIEPLTQGKISFLVNEICKRLNIKLERNKDKFGGLAYYYEFKITNIAKL